MKKNKIIVFGLVPLLLASCGNPGSSSTAPAASSPTPSSSVTPSASSSEEVPTPVKKQLTVTMVSHFGEHFGEDEFTDTAYYDDAWFTEDSEKTNYGLALFSTFTGGASYANAKDEYGKKIKDVLVETGYKDIELNDYYKTATKLRDSIGVIAANKKIKDASGKVYTLIAAFPRNAGYGAEWYGDFEMGQEGIHQGFLYARDEMLRFLKHYISAKEIKGDLKLWTAGYSRGAAAVNLVSGFLADSPSYLGDAVSLTPKNIYAYTVATPTTLPDQLLLSEVLSVSAAHSDDGVHKDTAGNGQVFVGTGKLNLAGDQYKGIHNFTAIGDYITKLPYKEWGFTRYGITEKVPYGDEKMISYLRQYSEETAQTFADKGGYDVERFNREIDFKNIAFVDSKTKISADAWLEERLGSLLKLGTDRADIVSKGYPELLGAVATVYGVDGNSFFDKAKGNISTAIKAGVLAYLTYAGERQKTSDKETLTNLMMDAVELVGKKIADRTAYTDQAFLKDILDFLINDYQNNAEARTKAIRISSLIPAPWGNLYLNFLDYAKEHKFAPTTVDGLLELVANYIHQNKEEEDVAKLIKAIAGIFPAQYIPLLGFFTGKAYDVSQYESQEAMAMVAVTDLMDVCSVGKSSDSGEEAVENTPEYNRGALLSMISSFVLGKYTKLGNLLVNGSHDDKGSVARDAANIKDFADDILLMLCGKDEESGETISVKEAANKTLIELLEACKSEQSAEYFDMVIAKPDKFREVLVQLLFNPKGEYSLENDINSALALVDNITYLFPAHDHELYLAYLKTKIAA